VNTMTLLEIAHERRRRLRPSDHKAAIAVRGSLTRPDRWIAAMEPFRPFREAPGVVYSVVIGTIRMPGKRPPRSRKPAEAISARQRVRMPDQRAPSRVHGGWRAGRLDRASVEKKHMPEDEGDGDKVDGDAMAG